MWDGWSCCTMPSSSGKSLHYPIMLPICDAGADVGPEERASTAGSPVAFEGDKVAAGGLGESSSMSKLAIASSSDMFCL